jgi:thiamine-phosphate pyrophosphorylase
LSSSAEDIICTFPGKRPLYYYITDRKALKGRSLSACIRRQISRKVDFIQIREKDLPDRALLKLASHALALARRSPTRILLNGRADIALAAGLHGVHLPSGGPFPGDIRPWTPPGFLIGVSVHSVREARIAAASGADYVLLGHVFATASKAAYGPPVGLDTLRRVCRAVTAPVFALGGIVPEVIEKTLDAGASGVAGISLFQHCIDFRPPTGQNRKY